MMETLRIKPSRGYGAPHAMFAGDGLALTIALGRVPAHSPYRAGDWVQCHGYPGYPAGPQQWGFRGFVLAGMGSTILRGLTDDGREWAEHWGALVPDGTRERSHAICVCCPRVRRRSARKAEQLDLLGLADLFSFDSKGEN